MVVVEVVAVVSGRDFRTRGRGRICKMMIESSKLKIIFSKQSKNKTYIPRYYLLIQ